MLQKNYATGKNKIKAEDTIALIPARSGSKSIKNKNIKLLGGKPLIAWSIESCKKSKLIKNIIVSTDSKIYARIALRYGATHIVYRPKKFSQDNSTDYQVLKHAIKSLKFLSYKFIAYIRPTTPIREKGVIDNAILSFIKSNCSSLRAVHEMPESAYKTFEIKKKNMLKPICGFKQSMDYFNLPRQSFKKTYAANGVVDVCKKEHLIKKNELLGRKVLAFKTPFTHEIDTIDQYRYLKLSLKNNKKNV